MAPSKYWKMIYFVRTRYKPFLTISKLPFIFIKVENSSLSYFGFQAKFHTVIQIWKMWKTVSPLLQDVQIQPLKLMTQHIQNLKLQKELKTLPSTLQELWFSESLKSSLNPIKIGFWAIEIRFMQLYIYFAKFSHRMF